jgi:cytoskeletal protein CcmA (bactofilin family)
MGIFGRDEKEQPPPQSAAGQSVQPGPRVTPVSQGHRTVITDTILVEGKLSGTGQIVVDGEVRGSIDGKDEVSIAARGRVEAAVHGRLVMVAGRVAGDITADEKIELEPTARVDGDITAPRILIKDGANFRGKVNMRPPEPRVEVTTSSAGQGPKKPDRD